MLICAFSESTGANIPNKITLKPSGLWRDASPAD